MFATFFQPPTQKLIFFRKNLYLCMYLGKGESDMKYYKYQIFWFSFRIPFYAKHLLKYAKAPIFYWV